MKTILIVLLIAAAAVLALGYYMFISIMDSHFKVQSKGNEDIIDSENDLMRPTAKALYAFREAYMDSFDDLPLKRLEIKSYDGLKLVGYLLEGNPKEVVICVHGYKSSIKEDFVDKIKIYEERGSTVLLVNDRAHGESQGRYIGFSELDRFDVKNWVEKINEMYDDPKIYLHGISMGGATVIHCADMKLKNVCGIIDDCGFDSILSISRFMMKTSFHLPFFPLGYAAWMWSILLAKISFDTSLGERCVANSDVPILFIHGEEDHYVPCEMSSRMYELCSAPKELHVIAGAGHAASYMMATPEYTKAVNRLMNGEIV